MPHDRHLDRHYDKPQTPLSMGTLAVSQVTRVAPMSQDDRIIKAKHLFLNGETIAAIAVQIGVNRRTIERWADTGKWRDERSVVSIDSHRSSPPPKPHRNPPSIGRAARQEIDEMAIVDGSIASLYAIVSGGDDGIDTRGIGSTASALLKFLQYRREIQPVTVADLAEMAIALGVRPGELAQAVKDAWQARA